MTTNQTALKSYDIKGANADGVVFHVMTSGKHIGTLIEDGIKAGATQIVIREVSDRELDALVQEAFLSLSQKE